MGATQMSLEHSATLPRASPSKGSVPLRPPMPDLTLRNAGVSVDSGLGSSAGSTRSILCSVRTAAVPCGSSPSSSIRASSARSWLTWLPREEGPAACLRRLSRLRAPWPHEARPQRSASCMAKPSIGPRLTEQGWARSGLMPTFSARQGPRRAGFAEGSRAPGYRKPPDPHQPQKESPIPCDAPKRNPLYPSARNPRAKPGV